LLEFSASSWCSRRRPSPGWPGRTVRRTDASSCCTSIEFVDPVPSSPLVDVGEISAPLDGLAVRPWVAHSLASSVPFGVPTLPGGRWSAVSVGPGGPRRPRLIRVTPDPRPGGVTTVPAVAADLLRASLALQLSARRGRRPAMSPAAACRASRHPPWWRMNARSLYARPPAGVQTCLTPSQLRHTRQMTVPLPRRPSGPRLEPSGRSAATRRPSGRSEPPARLPRPRRAGSRVPPEHHRAIRGERWQPRAAGARRLALT
jgi:hypothetical protein